MLAIMVILFTSCEQSTDNQKADLVLESAKYPILPFEKELFSLQQDSISKGLLGLQGKYGTFYDDYFTKIMLIGRPSDSVFPIQVLGFIQNSDFRMLANDCDSIYSVGKRAQLQQQLDKIMDQYVSNFGNDSLPTLVSFISGFNNGIVTGSKYIGIGLDMFLGENYRFYSSLDLPEFITRRYTFDHIAPLFLRGLFNYRYDFPEENGTLIERMLLEGKQLYWMENLAPEITDSLKMGYTKSQMEWCAANEANIYQLLLSENIFSTNYLMYRKYVEETPFTSNLGSKSAPRIASYCGWQIIKAYAKNSNATLDEIMREKDSQKILKIASYKP